MSKDRETLIQIADELEQTRREQGWYPFRLYLYDGQAKTITDQLRAIAGRMKGEATNEV